MPSFNVIAFAHPLRDERVVFELDAGRTLDDVLVALCLEHGAKPENLANAAILVDGELVPKDEWSVIYPRAGVDVVVRALPGDDFGSIFLQLAGLVLSAWVPPIGTPSIAGVNIGQLAIRAGITLATAMISQAIAPSPAPTLTPSRQQPENATYSIQGVRNELLPYGTIPRIFGHLVRYYPPLCAVPYTEIPQADDQYLRAMFCLGYGPLSISNIRIGETPISQLKGVTVEIRYGYDTDTPVTLIPSQVREEALSIELRQVDGYSTRTTEDDTDEIQLDVMFPSGLYLQASNGARGTVTVRFQVQYRVAGSGSAWSTPTLDPTYSYAESGGIWWMQGQQTSTFRRTVSFAVTRGKYEVQLKRISPDDQGDHSGQFQSNTVEKSFWSAIRSIKNEHPVTETGLAFIAVRIQGSDQLNGVIDQLSCDVQALPPVWNGSTWSNQSTRSPAWAYCEVLRGAANARPLADDRIDLDTMLDWASVCAAKGLTFDGVLNTRGDVFTAMKAIAACGRASPSPGVDGTYSVIIDRPQTQVVQHITPRNSANFKGTRTFSTPPHGIKVRFPNWETDHQIDEQIVYADGYSVTNATEFETLDLPYTTDWSTAFREARRLQASVALRPEIYSCDMDVEHIVCRRGDLVMAVSDVPLWGAGSARVAAVTVAGGFCTGITLDAAVTLDGDIDYLIRWRPSTGSSHTAQLVRDSGDVTDLVFVTPIDTGVDAYPEADDLVLLATIATDATPLIVRSIEPRDNHSATLTFVDHAPAIWNIDAAPIPGYQPRITMPTASQRRGPPAPQVTSVVSDETAIIRNGDGSLTSRIVVGYRTPVTSSETAPERTQARWRPRYTTQDWERAEGPPMLGTVGLAPVDDGTQYEIGLRSVTRFGDVSDWTVTYHTVVGKTTRPPDVERFYRRGDDLVWPYPTPPIDLAGFLVRANYGTSTNWQTATPLHTGVWPASPFSVAQLGGGTRTILIKAVDRTGNESLTAAHLELALGDGLTANVVNTYDEHPGFSGTITGGAVSGGALQANTDAVPAAWGPATAAAWGAPTDPAWVSSTYSELTYAWRYTPDATELDNALAKIVATITGAYALDYRISTAAAAWGGALDPAWGGPTDPAWPDSTIGEWTTFPGALGPFTTVADTYEFRVTIPSGTTQGVISALSVVVDVEDVVEHFESVAIAAVTGTRLTLTESFRAIKYISITVEDDTGAAISAKYFDKNTTAGAAGGPLIKCYDAAGAITAGTVSVTIQGY